jgi:hypothetical protein
MRLSRAAWRRRFGGHDVALTHDWGKLQVNRKSGHGSEGVAKATESSSIFSAFKCTHLKAEKMLEIQKCVPSYARDAVEKSRSR